MIDKLTHITVGQKKYPIAFTLNVMESVQEKYGTMEEWGKALDPDSGEPQIKDIIWTFREFLNEGIDIENDENGENRPLLTHKQVGRLVSSFDMQELGKMIRNLTVQSTDTGEEKDPNEKTTQNQA